MRGPQHRTPEQIALFKANAREDIVRRTGKRILFNVGDRWWDLIKAGDNDLQRLERAYAGAYVLFQPPGEAHTDWAVKLHETRN
jgi:hypothetical protein